MITYRLSRLFNIAAAISTLALCVVVIAWMAVGSRGIDTRTQFISFSPACHLTMWNIEGTRLVLFNDTTYGPYRGSIIGMVGGTSTRPATRPVWPKVTAFGDTAGIYYRHILWEDGTVLWTLAVSMWYAFGVTILSPLAWFVRHRYQHRSTTSIEHRPTPDSKSE